ncbi:MAG TPA: LiaF domain-containing protein [Mucilaginibacter sp.]|jgi:predicted membrane protein|nr:LiaF domain-containing protein [Mucilaginibacter sp.]
MNNDIIDTQNKPQGNGKILAGMILLVVGGILLLKQFDYLEIPGWIWSWPTWVILWALYSGARHNYRNSSWIIFLFIGMLGILNYAVPVLHLYNFIWPIIIISIGLWLILRRNNNWDKKAWKKDWEQKWDWRNHAGQTPPPPADDASNSSTTIPPADTKKTRMTGDDYLDAVSVFGGVKKTILSKTFKGGDIVNVFGGAEIDLTMADIEGKVVIDITQIFGGTKIIVPSHWQVVSNLSAVFAGVDDKRLRKTGSGDDNKILVLEGVSIFAGVDIRSY